MHKILVINIAIILFFSSCNSKEPKAFAFGNFESEEIIVSAESSGKLMEFTISEGLNLKTGDYCGYIDTTQNYLKKLQLRAGISSVNAKMSQLEKQIIVNEVSMKNLKREQNRLVSLIGGGAATTKQLDDLNGQIDVLTVQTDALNSQKGIIRAEKESLEIQVLQINDLISRSIVKSPANGTVLEKYLYAGELAVTGKPLFKMADLSVLILRVFVSGSQVETLKLGSEVDVFVDGENKELKKYIGVVSWVSGKSEFTPKIIQTREERVNLVYAVKIRVINDGGLKIGMPGEIHEAVIQN
jgi:HlyD family secretion protein